MASRIHVRKPRKFSVCFDVAELVGSWGAKVTAINGSSVDGAEDCASVYRTGDTAGAAMQDALLAALARDVGVAR
jgi:hypothetical protein